jgi:flagellar basal body-associated protein FliL
MSNLTPEELEQIQAAKAQFLATGAFRPIQYTSPLTGDPPEERVAKARLNYEKRMETRKERAAQEKPDIKALVEEAKKNPSPKHLEESEKSKANLRDEANKRLDEWIAKATDPDHKAKLNGLKQQLADMKL